jgi:hypothetical protein
LCHLQIVGDIKAAREALVEVTSRLRSYLYRELFQKDMTPPSISAPGPMGSSIGLEASSPNSIAPGREGHTGGDPPIATYQNVQTVAAAQPSKVTSFLDRLRNSLSLAVCVWIILLFLLHFLYQWLPFKQLWGFSTLLFFVSHLVKWNF